jgi:hypothetical protein
MLGGRELGGGLGGVPVGSEFLVGVGSAVGAVDAAVVVGAAAALDGLVLVSLET